MAGLRLGLWLGLGGAGAVVSGRGPTVPAQFADGDWSVANPGTGGTITISVTALPADGGAALSDLEYQIDGGAWVSLGAAAINDYPVSGLTNGVQVSVTLRAVNAIGAATASAGKTVTPAVGLGQFAGGDWSVANAGTGGAITISVTSLPADGGSALTDIEYRVDAGSWVSLGAATIGDYPVSGLSDDVAVTIALRAVNAIGTGTASAGKTVTPSIIYPPVRVSAAYVETLHSGTPAARVSTTYVETLHSGTPAARVSTTYVEVLRSEADAA